jgi:hypothetical protein
VPAPPMLLLFGGAAGAMFARRRKAGQARLSPHPPTRERRPGPTGGAFFMARTNPARTKKGGPRRPPLFGIASLTRPACAARSAGCRRC